MIISFSRRFIFVHIPKTAGSSIDRALEPYAEPLSTNQLEHLLGLIRLRTRCFKYHPRKRFRRHVTADQIRRHLAPEIFEGCFKFAFVRNPWDWMVSYYHYVLQVPKHHRHQAVTGLQSFEDYLDYEIRRNKTRQKQFVVDGQGRQIVDFIGRFENLEADFAEVCRRMKLGISLPRVNQSRHRDYRSYFNSRTIELVAEHYREDIEMFGYTFDGVARRQAA